MLGIGCLVKDTTLRHDLDELVEYFAYSRVGNGEDAGIASVYNDIRKEGIEVDLQTIGYIYNDKLPKSYKQFTPDHDVNNIILKGYNDAIRRAAFLETPEDEHKQIGHDKPEVAVVNSILNMFTNAHTEDAGVTMSDFRTMQEALWKGAQRLLKLPTDAQEPVTREEWKQILERSMGYEKLGINDVYGQINGIEKLYNAMQTVLNEAREEMRYGADPSTLEKFDEMVKRLQSTSYSLLFSTKEGSDFINSIMKEAGFGKEVNSPTGPKNIIDWNKLSNEIGSVADIRANVERVMRHNKFSEKVIDGVKDSFEQEFNELHAKMIEFKANQLIQKENAIGRAGRSKTDLKRLAELNNYGIFESAHDKLLNKIIGVSDLEQQDFDNLKQIAKAASDLYRHIDNLYHSDIFASSAFQTLQRWIDQIVSRNINNKSKLMKVSAWTKNIVEVQLTGLLMSPLTISENWLSGTKAIFEPIVAGKAQLDSTDRKVYWAMLKDVSIRGQSFGEEVGSFAPRDLWVNSLQYSNWKTASTKDKGKMLLKTIMMPASIGLTGFDSANKVVITNKIFYNVMYKALKARGKTDEQAYQILSEALNGKSLEKAKGEALNIVEMLNKQLPITNQYPTNDAVITRLANDLIKANLISDGVVTPELIEQVMKASYHVAGLALGHEPNNILSTGIRALRDKFSHREQQLVREKKWKELAMTRLTNTLINGFILKFTGGSTNWIFIRAQSGLIIPGLFPKIMMGLMGEWNEEPDFTDMKNLKQQIRKMENARNAIGRSIVGVATLLLGYGLTALFRMGDEKKNMKRLSELMAMNKKDMTEAEKEELEYLKTSADVWRKIYGSYEGRRLFKKISPDLMLLAYFEDTDPNELQGVIDYIDYAVNNSLTGQYSLGSYVHQMTKLALQGDWDGVWGQLGAYVGGQWSTPLWRSYKEWYKMGKWIGGGNVASDYKTPTNFSEGLLGGGLLENWGLFNRNSSIIALPGIGIKSYEKFKELGIKNMNDLISNPNWYNYLSNGKLILDSDQRDKAKAGAEKWFKENE